jgi:hypothetical protein
VTKVFKIFADKLSNKITLQTSAKIGR